MQPKHFNEKEPVFAGLFTEGISKQEMYALVALHALIPLRDKPMKTIEDERKHYGDLADEAIRCADQLWLGFQSKFRE